MSMKVSLLLFHLEYEYKLFLVRLNFVKCLDDSANINQLPVTSDGVWVYSLCSFKKKCYRYKLDSVDWISIVAGGGELTQS